MNERQLVKEESQQSLSESREFFSPTAVYKTFLPKRFRQLFGPTKYVRISGESALQDFANLFSVPTPISLHFGYQD
ncbi:unnamed protein product [Clavelina lepadiformis]|uniref:Uncharacterized protein n=1 Tax=Clavelina lepadiformis TaxID=159417 RepID=A0ABP0FQQ6_CLALP